MTTSKNIQAEICARYFNRLRQTGYMNDKSTLQTLTGVLIMEAVDYFAEFIDQTFMDDVDRIMHNLDCCTCTIQWDNYSKTTKKPWDSYIYNETSDVEDTPSVSPTVPSEGNSGNSEGNGNSSSNSDGGNNSGSGDSGNSESDSGSSAENPETPNVPNTSTTGLALGTLLTTNYPYGYKTYYAGATFQELLYTLSTMWGTPLANISVVGVAPDYLDSLNMFIIEINSSGNRVTYDARLSEDSWYDTMGYIKFNNSIDAIVVGSSVPNSISVSYPNHELNSSNYEGLNTVANIAYGMITPE